jgi:hypothetical protein
MPTPSADGFVTGIRDFQRILRTAVKNRCNLGTHRTYAPKARSALATLRRSFLLLKRDYPDARFPRVAFQLAAIEPLVSKVVELFPSEPREMLRLVQELELKVDSDLAAELEAPDATPSLSTAFPFLPGDLIPNRYGVLQRVLWEANRSYEVACYNACAAMMRRVVETLVIEAFEHLNIAGRIRHDGEYLEFGALVGKAAAEPLLRLTRNTKRVLPDLKFLGDLGAHSRMALVRRDDLDRIHNALRAGIEELLQSV